MHRLSTRFLPLMVAISLSLSLVSVAAATNGSTLNGSPVLVENQHQPGAASESSSTTNIQENVLWMFAGIGAATVVLTALYMLKRQLGAFPENPDWVAPITILRSKDAPDEGAYGSVAAHDSHGSHH